MLKFSDKKYKIILADPPWKYNDKLGTNSAKMGVYYKYYKGMELKDICNLPIQDLADDNCILFLGKIFEEYYWLETNLFTFLGMVVGGLIIMKGFKEAVK